MPRAPFQVLVIPWRRRGDALEVCAFHRTDYDVWQFVSGGGEQGETALEAARREGHEEAGITSGDYLALDSTASLPACWFPAWSTWPAHVFVIPEHAFAVEVVDVQRSDEHRDLRWCGVAEAMALLKFDSNRHALWELDERLFPKPRIKRHVYL